MSEEELVLKIKSLLDDKGFQEAISRTGQVKNEFSGLGKVANSLGGAAMVAGKAIAAGIAIGGVAVAAFATKAVMMASDIGESQSKVNVVFGESAQVINDLASTASTAMGMTKAEVLSAAGGVGNLLTAMGQTKEKAAEMSVNMVKLATDLGSFNNASSTDVLAAMTAAMAGETDGMKKYGVVINETTLKNAAMAEGLGSNVQALSASQKQMLSMKIMMEQTTSAQGDFARTSTGLANTMKIIKSSFTDVVTEIGQKLLPTVQAAAGAFASEFALAKTAGADPLEAALSGLAGTLESLGFERLSEAVAGLASSVGPIIKDFVDVFTDLKAPVDDGASALAILGENIDTAAPKASGLRDTFETVKDMLDKWIPVIKDAGDKVVAFGGFLVDHKGVVLTVIAIYGAFKVAMAINKAVDAAKASLVLMKGAWLAYQQGASLSTTLTTVFGTSLKFAMGPIGWLIIAVGLLWLAWKTNFGGIQEKTQVVVDYVKTIPAKLGAAWEQLKVDVATMVVMWAIKWATLKADLGAAWDGMIAYLAGIPAKFKQAGTDIIAGLKAGALDAWNRFLSWFKGVIALLPASVKKILGIASPSHVFYMIGHWIVEGLALGIRMGGVLATQALGLLMGKLQAARDAVQPAREAVDRLAASAQALRDGFLRGGAGEAGSLAWFMGRWGEVPDFKGIFASLRIPVDGIDEFANLLDRLVKEGHGERAQELWTRFYETVSTQEDDRHEAVMANLEKEAQKAVKDQQKIADDAKAIFEAQARYIEQLVGAKADEQAKKSGGGKPEEIDAFDDKINEVQEKLRGFLTMLGYQGTTALEDFWVAFTGGARKSIENSAQLIEAINALGEAAAKEYDRIMGTVEDANTGRAVAEEDRHKAAIKMLQDRAAMISLILEDQSLAEAELNRLIEVRDALLERIRQAIADAQSAAEAFASRVHDKVMAYIEQERSAVTAAHKLRKEQLEKELADVEEGHRTRANAIQAEQQGIEDGFKAREAAIAHERVQLEKLVVDLGVGEAIAELDLLSKKLASLQTVMSSFKIELRGKDANDEVRRQQTEKVRAVTDEQKAALQAAKDSGKLSKEELHTVELMLLGYKGKKSIVDEILARQAKELEGDIATAQAKVDANAAQVAAKAKEISDAEYLLKLDKDAAVAKLEDIAKRAKAEDDRYAIEVGQAQARITAEQAAFDAKIAFLDGIAKAEDDRHAQRMADIAAEYALQLAQLGMTETEIQAMVTAAQELAKKIGEEAEELYRKIIEGMPGQGMGTPYQPPATPPPVRPIAPIDLEALNKAVKIEAEEATVKTITLGNMVLEGTQVVVKLPSGKDLAAELVELITKDTALLDIFGNRLNERQARRGQTGGR